MPAPETVKDRRIRFSLDLEDSCGSAVDDAYLASVLAIALKDPARVIVLLGRGENSTQGGGR